jgi:RHH-type proline utilization regulon transcriptional repressor/proline dehydrogenase/delta 1-pyrroline-5-carboxylate dehydrogenase
VDFARSTPLAFELDLPGPTGESNRESFHPHGRVLCQAHDRNGLFDQLAAVFATGNRALVATSANELVHDMPSAARAAIDFAPEPAATDIDLALCIDLHDAAELRRVLAAREGKRVRVVTPIDGVYPLAALVVERVVSVNTAAAGGNASLMTLEPL